MLSARPFPPSLRRRAIAHAEGDVVRAPLMTAAVVGAAIAAMLPAMTEFVRERLVSSLEMLLDPRALERGFDAAQAARAIAPWLLAPPLLFATSAFVIAGVAGGVRFGPPRVLRDDAGLGRGWVFVRTLVVASTLGALTAIALTRVALRSAWRISDPTRALSYASHEVASCAQVGLAVLLVIGVGEVALGSAAWRARWSMSRRDRELDQRESAGDPAVRARVAALARTITDRA